MTELHVQLAIVLVLKKTMFVKTIIAILGVGILFSAFYQRILKSGGGSTPQARFLIMFLFNKKKTPETQ